VDDATGFTITRTFAAPRGPVFTAWTTPEQFGRWFGGTASEVPLETIEMDVRPGGAWKATMFAGPDRYEIGWRGEYVVVDAPEHLELTLTDGPEAVETIDVHLAESDGRTEMTTTQSGGHLTAEQYEQAKAGWQTFFDAMAEIVEA
jgi:uncharacterized protein YndB with AHSA1/START domain